MPFSDNPNTRMETKACSFVVARLASRESRDMYTSHVTLFVVCGGFMYWISVLSVVWLDHSSPNTS